MKVVCCCLIISLIWQAPAPAPPAEKVSKKADKKPSEKNKNVAAEAKEVPLDPVAEKLLQQR